MSTLPGSKVSVVVQLFCRVQLFVTPWMAAHPASLSFSISQSLLKLMSMELMMPSSHLSLCRPLLLLPSIFPSIRVFSNERLYAAGGQSTGASAAASVLPMKIQNRFALGWTGLIPLQSKGLSSLLQHRSSKASILRHTAEISEGLSYI